MNEYYLPKIIEENKNVHDTIFYFMIKKSVE